MLITGATRNHGCASALAFAVEGRSGEGAGIEAIPIPRQGTLDECTATVVFLASEQASYITGQTYPVNGGAYFL